MTFRVKANDVPVDLITIATGQNTAVTIQQFMPQTIPIQYRAAM